MHVIQILREKGREVVSLSSENTLSEAVHLLTRKRIGAVVVRDGQGAIAGILSERDIVRAVAEEGADALSRTVNAYMTRAVATCTEFETVEDLMKMISELPEVYRMIFNMYAIDGLTHKEISEILNIKESTSRANLTKARFKLKKSVEDILIKERATYA